MTYILKDSQTSETDFWNVGTGRPYVGSSFTPGSSYTLARVELKLNKNGAPVGNVICQIYSDSAGSPNTVLATSTNSIDSSTLPTTADYTPQFNFAGLALVNGTKYHIVIHGDGTGGGFGSDTIQWRSTSAGDTTGQDITEDADGTAPFSSTSANAQGDFKTYLDDGVGGALVGFGGSKRPAGTRGPRDRRGFLKQRAWSYDILAVAVSGAAIVSGGGNVGAGGFKSSGGVAVVSASSRATSSGSKATSGSAVISSSSRVTAAASKGASNIAVIKGGGRVVTVSLKNGAASVIVSSAGSGSAIGFKGALNTARSSTSSRVFAFGNQSIASSRFAIVSSSSRVTALGIKGAAAVAVVSASSRTMSTGQKAAFSIAVVRSSSRVTAFETTARSGTARVSASARAIVSAQKNAAGPVRISASGQVLTFGRVEVITLAIARSDGSIGLATSSPATTGVQQNSATTPLGVSHSASTPLAWQNFATTPLDTSE